MSIMNIIELISQYRNKLKDNSNDYSCLLFALQLPSICSRIEFKQNDENTGNSGDGKFYKPNGRVFDANIYTAWIKAHKMYFQDIYKGTMSIEIFCKNIYNLRCQVTHEGILMSDKNKFYFIHNDCAMCVGDTVFLPVKQLCEDMFNAAIDVLSKYGGNVNISLFEDILIPDDIYKDIRNDVQKTYGLFWNNRSEADQILYGIYINCFFDNPCLQDKIEKFFNNTPDKIFEICDSSSNFGCIYDVKEMFIHKDYDEYVLRLSKAEYEKMLQISQELEDFYSNHQIDILKRCK